MTATEGARKALAQVIFDAFMEGEDVSNDRLADAIIAAGWRSNSAHGQHPEWEGRATAAESEVERLKQHLSGYETRIPMAPEHLAKMPRPTGDYEADLAAMADALTDEMIPEGPPTWGFVQWELTPPDGAVALFSLEAGLIHRATAAESERDALRAVVEAARGLVLAWDYGDSVWSAEELHNWGERMNAAKAATDEASSALRAALAALPGG